MAEKSLRLASNAKINIGLLVKGRRPDGYHLLETLMYPVKMADTLTIRRSSGSDLELQMKGNKVEVPRESNLIYKAWKALEKKVGGLPGLKIDVKKTIPAGAGLGGGSSNAAFTLSGLNELLELGLSLEELVALAKPLGADVPFFLHNQPMIATGIGHDLEPYDIEIPYDIGLVTPGIHSSTVLAYKGLHLEELEMKRSLRDTLALPIDEWQGKVVNDLEGPVFEAYPLLSNLKNDLYVQGAAYVSMTGSGSGIFAFFDKL